MAAIWAGEHGDLKNGVKDTAMIDRMEKITAKHNFIIPAGNHEGTPSEGNVTAQAVYFDPKTMEPFQDVHLLLKARLFTSLLVLLHMMATALVTQLKSLLISSLALIELSVRHL